MPTLAEIDAEIARRQQQPTQPSIGPSLADIDAEIARRQPQQQIAQPEGSRLSGILEPAAAIGTGVASTIAGGLAGTAQAINPFADEGAGAEAVKAIQSGGTFVPKTKKGQGS